jgi:RHS repeat-associated protein
LYGLSDPRFSLLAIADTSGTVQERYNYDGYGRCLVMAPNFKTRTTSSFAWEYRYTGRRLDLETGIYYFRARYYHAELGRFISRDPIGYVDGMNLYRGYMVPNGVDPYGSQTNSLCDGIYKRCLGAVLPSGGVYGRPPSASYVKTAKELCAKHLKECKNSVGGRQGNILLGMLQAACNSCPDKDCKEGEKAKCTKQQCLEDAEAISLAIYYTIRNIETRINWRSPIRVNDQRKWGWYCSRWAHGFDDAIDDIKSPCFSSKTNGRFRLPYGEGLGEEHVWVEVTLECNGKVVAYIDDSFGSNTAGCTKGDWVHPCAPDLGWEHTGANSKPGEAGCNVPAFGPDGRPIE